MTASAGPRRILDRARSPHNVPERGGKVLLLGSDSDWCAALQIDLEAEGWRTYAANRLDEARESLESGEVVAAVIAAFGNRYSHGTTAAIETGKALRGLSRNLPLLFDMSVPDYALTAFVLDSQPARFVFSERQGSLSSALESLLRKGRRMKSPGQPRFAAIEIQCELASVTFAARLDHDMHPIGPFPIPWNQERRLKEINDDFKVFRLYESNSQSGKRLKPGWSDKLKETGSQLCSAVGLDDGAQAAVLASFVGKLGDLKHVHFRFSLPHDSMDYIPFELVWDSNRKYHLRELAPVARRVLLDGRQTIALPPPRATPSNLRERVLFIKSPAHGSMSVPGELFGRTKDFLASRLTHLDTELEYLREARRGAGLPAPTELVLAETGESLDAILDVLQNPWNIVHFAGHSVMADSGEVYLLLPGERGPVPLRMQDFADAAHQAAVRLIVLSSCESTSPDAVFRLAQSGIPAAIGFRWEVDDREAAEFTFVLHRALAVGDPVGRAFHAAVRRLKTKYLNSPTFASPVLMIQDEEWAEPTATV